jgi:hypothetical protein
MTNSLALRIGPIVRLYLGDFTSAAVAVLLNHTNGVMLPPVGHSFDVWMTRELSSYHDGMPKPSVAASPSL